MWGNGENSSFSLFLDLSRSLKVRVPQPAVHFHGASFLHFVGSHGLSHPLIAIQLNAFSVADRKELNSVGV